MYQLWYICAMSADDDNKPILDVVFYKTEAGNEPVREWLKSLPRADQNPAKRIGYSPPSFE